MSTAQDLGHVYGTCKAVPCACLRGNWLGRGCPNWQPTPATTYAELAAWALGMRAVHSGSGSTQSSGPNWI